MNNNNDKKKFRKKSLGTEKVNNVQHNGQHNRTERDNLCWSQWQNIYPFHLSEHKYKIWIENEARRTNKNYSNKQKEDEKRKEPVKKTANKPDKTIILPRDFAVSQTTKWKIKEIDMREKFTYKWYMHLPESVFENEMQMPLSDFGIQMNHLISQETPKSTWQIMGFSVLAVYWVRIKEI